MKLKGIGTNEVLIILFIFSIYLLIIAIVKHKSKIEACHQQVNAILASDSTLVTKKDLVKNLLDSNLCK